MKSKVDPKDQLPVADVNHIPRLTDLDKSANKKAQRQITLTFMLSMLMAVAFVFFYIAIDKHTTAYIPVFGVVGLSNFLLGLTMGLSITLIGIGAIQWAKKLMSDVEVVQDRHELKSEPAAEAVAASNYRRGKAESGFGEFKLLRRTLIGAMALMPIPLVVAARDLWNPSQGTPSPADILSETMWKAGERIIVAGTDKPLKPEDLAVGGLISAIPAALPHEEEESGNLNQRTKAAIILVRMEPNEIVSQQGEKWDYEGIVAYSKICTHVGCPIALYEQRTHHLLCPCHQSTFDLADSGEVIFGPAARRMPQLPIGVDDEGYLIALSDFQEPVGPSFWERS